MFVFHSRELDALERADPVSALTVARLVECVAFGTEPEWSADPLSIRAFSRWVACLPKIQGTAIVRGALQHKVQALAQALETPWREKFETAAGASNASSELASVADQFSSDCLKCATRRFEAALESGDSAEIVNSAAETASLWISNFIHPQTVFKKLVGYVLDPESQQRDSNVQDRLKRVREDFGNRVLQRHSVSVCINLPGRWSPPEPAIAGVQMDLERGSKAVTLSTLVDAPDPESAAWMGRDLLSRSLSTLRGCAKDFELELPPTLKVTMPNGQQVEISCRLFRSAPPRLVPLATFGQVQQENANRFYKLAGELANARRSFDLGECGGAIVALWRALEQFIRLNSEARVPDNVVEARLATPFLTYFACRQVAIFGVYLGMARATRPRVQYRAGRGVGHSGGVNVERLAARLVSGQLDTQFLRQERLARYRSSEIRDFLQNGSTLSNGLVQERQRIGLVLFGARQVRNAHLHTGQYLQSDAEGFYIYKWLDTLLDVLLNQFLYLSRDPSFTLDSYLDGQESRWRQFLTALKSRTHYGWLLSE